MRIQEDKAPLAAPSVQLPALVVEHASSFCPVCSEKLTARKCKLICPTCGYYMSCSDYY